MFEPDKFSDANPRWLSISETALVPSGLLELLEKEYSSFLGKINGIYASSALELNSQNLLVVGEKEKLVVKLCPELAEESFQRHVKIYNLITSQNLPSVEMMGAFFRPFDNKTSVIICHYYPGNYFSGNSREFIKTFEALETLICSFPSESFDLFVRHSPYPDNGREVVVEFFECLFRRKINLDEESLCLVKANKENILNADLFARKFTDTISNLEDSLGYVDLHPHNIIVNNERITFLDIDALKVSKWPLYLGFGVFKLLRQTYASTNTLVDPQDLKKIISSFTACNINYEDALGLTFGGAKWEVTRRLQIIMKGNLGGRASRWNSVLPIQIKALEEVEFLRRYYDTEQNNT